MADTESTLLAHLEFLYGSVAGPTLDDLLRLMESFRGRIKPRSREDLTEKDVVLITYGDMVRQRGRPPLASLGEFLDGHISDIINTVHILPFYPYSSDDGFSVVDYYQVDPALGDWSDVARVRQSFRLMFDAVLNHISAESEWFRGFQSGDPRYRDYFTVVDPGTDLASVFRPRELPLLTEVETAGGPRHVWTTFSDDQIDLNYRSPAVLLAAIEVLLTYVARGADVIRLDAIAFIWKGIGTSCIHRPEAHRIVQLFRSVLDEIAPSVLLITETNVPHAENVSYFGDGTNEADLVYNFALPPLTLHAFHAGDASVLSEWARSLRAPSQRTTFFNFLASHDGIGVGGARDYLTEAQITAMAERTEQIGGNVSYRTGSDGARVPYELNINYLDALGDTSGEEPDDLVARRFLTSQAMMLSVQGMPAIYFHSLFGSRGWAEGVTRTSAYRTVNREKPDRTALEVELATADSLRSQVFRGYRRLLQVRISRDAFMPQSPQEVVGLDDRLFAVLRTGSAEPVLCLHNVSTDSVHVNAGRILASQQVTDLISGVGYGGSVEIGSYQTLWLIGDSK